METPESTTTGPAKKKLSHNRTKLFISIGVGIVILFAGAYLLVTRAASATGTIKALGNCMDNAYGRLVKGNPVQMYRCDNSSTQVWTLPGDGSITFGTSKYCLDVRNSAKIAKSIVQLNQCTGGASQKWTIRTDKSILNPNSGLCLDVKYASIAEATPIWLWPCNGTDAQKWTVPVATLPAPTPAPEPAPSPAPTPPPTYENGSTTCPLPKYPSPLCAGVRLGTVFTKTINGDYDATTPGMVIDGWHITGDLHIKAADVVIKNSQIDRSVFNRYGASADNQKNTFAYTISDSTIGPVNGCIRQAGLQEANYTATRVHIRGVDHGIDVSEPGNVVLQDSYVALCYLDASVTPPDGSHVDGIQTFCPDGPCTNIRLSHNTMIDPTHKGTFVINLVDPNLGLADGSHSVTLTDNLLYGGDNYVIVTQWRRGSTWTVHNNRVVSNTWGGATAASAEGTCSHQDWQGNSIVTIDGNYNITSTVKALPCIE